MLTAELEDLVLGICTHQSDPQTVACIACKDMPHDLYDLISAFANQDEGGVVVFGIDEDASFELTGVDAVLDLQQVVLEQCAQMTPAVTPLFTNAVVDGMRIVSAEIPAVETAARPCHYAGNGAELGSFKRVGYSVEQMSARELYSLTANAERTRDDIRPLTNPTPDAVDPEQVAAYLAELREIRPSLASLTDGQVLALTGLERDGAPTLAELLLFGRYPQADFGQLCIVATLIQEVEDADGMVAETAVETVRFEGTVAEMIAAALDYALGEESEAPRVAIPRAALQEALINAVEHRDYSVYTESIPIQLVVRTGSVEIVSPGGLFGSTRIDQLGTSWCDVRNTTLANAMATLGLATGNQGGLTVMADVMEQADCPEPEIWCDRANFSVTLYAGTPAEPVYDISDDTQKLLAFCTTPRSRSEIAELLGLSSVAYVTNHYIMPAVERGLLSMSLPDKPRSKNQRYTTVG